MSKIANEPIAIVGMGCRFAGDATSPSKLWGLLSSPHEVAQDIPPTRFNIDRFYHPNPTHHGTTATKQAYLLSEDVRLFDTKFFAIPPAESEVIDPQQRQLLEVVYEALESAGLASDRLAGSDTACFVGLMSQEYFALQGQDVNMVRTYAGTGTAASNASSRVSYFFDWHGPCMTIDTACSSSMVGVNEAVQALRNGSSRVAVACGTNLVLSPLSFITLSKLNMLSPTGRCRMWDADADGYARGEGVAAIVLKTLSSALEDGDEVLSVIREIGVNHDGRTKGLTMPSSAAQAALIRQTYAKAGLDLTKRSDRCQFFEAHGTGTAVGDPQEAEAICSAMFSSKSDPDLEEILVGSIKTVVGHTEGTAGVAGLIKTTLALREGIVPPNLLFNRLNPALEPFVDHLRIPTSCEPWPEVLEGGVRRASVNSFGFGGSNAHVILESFTGNNDRKGGKDQNSSTFSVPVPFIFSAASKTSLSTLLRGAVGYLEKHTADDEVVDMSALAYTLSTKRSALSQRVAIPAVSADQLLQKIKAALEADDDYAVQAISSSTTESDAPGLLGVFTGQGAQWPAMGANLIATVPMAREILRQLDSSLAALPADHRPDWTLLHALSPKNDENDGNGDIWQSRVNEAAFSQPLCTAVQIVLVDLLHAAGVKFRAVVGHSSGEIAAAYAAGFLTATDAIRIAYYRGFFATKLAVGLGGKMVAVGTSLEDAEELCQLDDFAGKLSVAAHNAPSSVTLSGDAEAVIQAESVFLEEKKFARVLRVNTAYHSHHMMVCADAYLAALTECGVKVQQPAEGNAMWFSSVFDGQQVSSSTKLGQSLSGQYWVDNMTKPVLFYTAIESCLTAATFDTNAIMGVLEVGPHPALQAPATESILQVCGKELPYSGTLRRGQDDVESFSQALGYLWTRFGPGCVNLGRFQEACQQQSSSSVLHDLPSYPWNHDRVLWAESRLAKLFSKNPGRPHDLLGLDMAEGTVEEMRWRNVLKINELKWLAGHSLQGQIVFPATAYIAIAMEAAMQMVGMTGGAETSVQSIDLLDLRIPKAIALNDSGTELVTSMTHIKRSENVITAEFNAFSTTGTASMALNCTGHVRIMLGANSSTNGLDQKEADQEQQGKEEEEAEAETTTGPSRFAARGAPQGHLSTIDVDRFYQVLRDDFGFGYDGAFHGLTSIQRKTNYATATIRNPVFEKGETRLLFHPGMLDSALQGLNAAYSAPGDGRLWSIVAPTAVRRITLVPELCGEEMTDEVLIDCTITDPRPNCVTGDVNVFLSYPCQESEEGVSDKKITKQCIEVEGITFSPFAAATKDDDRLLFQEAFLTLDKPDATLIYGDRKATPREAQKALDAERAAFFYLKNLHLTIDAEKRTELPSYRQALLSNAERIYNRVKDGQHPFVPAEWISDTKEDIVELMDSYGSDDADFNLTRAVGDNLTLPTILSGESSILEHMTQNNRLDKYYTDAIGFEMLNGLISGVAEQLCNKYPHMRMLEVGGGTGGATQAIFGRIGSAFASYTYTDISSAFFGYAAQRFAAQAHKMLFKTLDISQDPTKQGFKKHSYDIVFASNVLHATESLKTSVEHARQLLRPGGYLVMVEIIRNDVLRHGLVMGGLPGWWVGEKDGRIGGPSITLEEWDAVLRETGFDGIETNSPMLDPVGVPGAVIVAQASTEQVQILKNSLTAIDGSSEVATATRTGPTLVLLGSGKESSSSSAFLSNLCDQLSSLIQAHFSQIIHLTRLEDHDSIVSQLPKEDVHVISLVELEGSNIFEDASEPAFLGLKAILSSAQTVLWLLTGDGGNNPYAGITVGLFRTLFFELPGTLLQTLDLGKKVDRSGDIDEVDKLSSMVAELSLRLRTLGDTARRGGTAHEGRVEDGGAIGDQVLWNFEPELVLDESGRLRVPRVRPHDEQNARYNSAKRQITKMVDLNDHDTVLEVRRTETSYALQELHEVDRLGKFDDICTVRVSCSLLSTVKTPAGFVFVSYGTDVKTGEKRLCFSDKNASTLTMPLSWTVAVENNDEVDVEGLDVQLMMFVTADLLAQQLLVMLPPIGTVLAYEPDPIISNLLTSELGRRGRKAVFVTSNPDLHAQRPDWVYLHPHSSKRDIDQVMPPDVTLYVDASSMGHRDDNSDNGLGPQIAHSLPRVCDRISFSSLMADEASPLLCSPAVTDSNIDNTAPESIQRLLKTASSNALRRLGSIYDWEPLDILGLPQVVSPLARPKPNSLVYWSSDRPVAVSVAPILEWRKDLFRSDRTYWLAGLSGDVGRSMADFMVENGARYIALSSRTPKVEEGWVAWHKKRGSTISYFSGDVTNWESMNQTYDAITTSMPPISGVANGAMVLRDVSLITMTFEDFITVLRPKVQGTLNLDRLFSSPERELDFFICFSSIAGTLGNPGQSAYSAGNCFMKSLVRCRRNRGLPGAAIDIGRLVGVGYIERESSGRLTKEHQTRLQTRSGAVPMSETDLHQLFAEAIIAGRPPSPSSAPCSYSDSSELISSIVPITTEQAKQAYWSSNPRLGLLIREMGQQLSGSGGGGNGNAVPVRQLLEAAKTMGQVESILLATFKVKLQALKFLPDADSIYDATPLVEMGVDSLVAVEMRSWFLKELGVDVPVMTILGGASIADLVRLVVDKLPAELLERVGGRPAPTTPSVTSSSNESTSGSVDGLDAGGKADTDVSSVASVDEKDEKKPGVSEINVASVKEISTQ
ncbi:hypothetical protein COL5a_011935 [Colletotrichum fioriniae]|nr:hypothetical protein COL5a_011935 [Colletotrichum fioriniae]